MIARVTIVSLFCAMTLAGQDLSARPSLPDIPPIPQLPEIRDYHGKFQGVVVHRLEVEPKATLIMKSIRGEVILLGTDINRIVIEEKVTVKTRDRDRAKDIIEAVQGTLSPPSGKDDPYVFQVDKWSSRDVWYEYKVRVPRTFNIIVNSYGGDIDLSDIQGDLEAKTGGGDIALSNSKGKIMVKSAGGDIDAYKLEGQIELLTGGGDIEGRTLEGKINAVTGGGNIDFWTSTGNFNLNTGGGDIDLRSLKGPTLEARTGGGDINAVDITAKANLLTSGGDICAENVSGNFEAASGDGDLCLQHLKGDAVLYTGSGDVEVCYITGAVDIKSGSGDIQACELTLENPGKDESSLTTGHGDIYLNYNTEKPVDISAVLIGYSPHYAQEYIHGNVDLKFEKHDGSTEALLRTQRPIHRINIETRSGEITIIKGEQ